MSIPLDRLYNFLNNVIDRDNVLIYRFFPHGSKNISNLLPMTTTTRIPNVIALKTKLVIFNDQEPLNFDFYTTDDTIKEFYSARGYDQWPDEIAKSRLGSIARQIQISNFKAIINLGLHDTPVILVHSEKRSDNLAKYEQIKYIGAYWWCHATIARDWFRYAEYDTVLHTTKTITHDFLIYNRAWTGTREYRLKFTELLVQHNLEDHCLTWFNPTSDEHNYRDYQFKNSNFALENFELHNLFDATSADSSASADYCAGDYLSTNIEVVLETLFDDSRLHLTEKTLRPIACAQPFMLVATVGSLEYLRSYGFETFGELIDESYDTITDPLERLQAVCKEMKRISLLDTEQKTKLFTDMQQIALRNQQKFFSQEWQQSIIDEFKQNFDAACQQLTS